MLRGIEADFSIVSEHAHLNSLTSWSAEDGSDKRTARPGSHFRLQGGVRAFALLLVRLALGYSAGISGRDASILAQSLKDGDKKGQNGTRNLWCRGSEQALLRGHASVSELLLERSPVSCSVDKAMLPRKALTLRCDGAHLVMKGKVRARSKLEHLETLLSSHEMSRVTSVASEPEPGTPDLGDRLERKFENGDWRPRFIVEPLPKGANMLIPVHAATQMLRQEIERFSRLHDDPVFALSGGVAQGLVTRHFEEEARNRPLSGGKRCTLLALNRMAWPDGRLRRSADALALRFAAAIGSERVASVPVTTDHPGWERDYSTLLERANLLLLSGGSAGGSFVSQYLVDCGVRIPPHAVGDLAGHWIDSTGQGIRDPEMDRRLAGFRCHPSLDRLRAFAATNVPAQERRTVMLVLYDWLESSTLTVESPGANASLLSKLPLLRACLAGRLVNTFVLPAPTARALLASGPGARGRTSAGPRLPGQRKPRRA